jgi:hypothetical protein
MRYIRRQSTNRRLVNGSLGVNYDIEGQVVLDSKNVMLIPKGTTADRPRNPKNGHMRFNTDTGEFEVYQDSQWRRIGFKEPNRDPGIKAQLVGNGDAVETIFGPLNNEDPEHPVPVNEAHILVFIENVYQLPITNYRLIQNPAGRDPGWYLNFGDAVPLGKPVTVLHNFDK